MSGRAAMLTLGSRRGRRVAVAVVLTGAAALGGVSGCADDTAGSGRSTGADERSAGERSAGEGSVGSERTTTTAERSPTTTSAPATPSTLSEEDEILATVHGAWDAILRANNPPDPDHPDLPRYLTGEQLARSRETARGRRDRGEAVRLRDGGRYRHSLSLVDNQETSAVVKDCLVDDSMLVRAGTGELLDGDVVVYLFAVTVVREPDQPWRVSAIEVESSWDGGEPGCAESL